MANLKPIKQKFKITIDRTIEHDKQITNIINSKRHKETRASLFPKINTMKTLQYDISAKQNSLSGIWHDGKYYNRQNTKYRVR